jgi:hypothetical protein
MNEELKKLKYNQKKKNETKKTIDTVYMFYFLAKIQKRNRKE